MLRLIVQGAQLIEQFSDESVNNIKLSNAMIETKAFSTVIFVLKHNRIKARLSKYLFCQRFKIVNFLAFDKLVDVLKTIEIIIAARHNFLY